VTGLGSPRTTNFGASPVADFSLLASPLTINQGSNGASAITVTSFNGFNGTVALSVSSLPASVTASFNPSSITPAANGSATSTLTLTASSTATVGPTTVIVTGTSGPLTHTTILTLTVVSPAKPDFSITANPSSRSIRGTGVVTYTVTITRLNGYSGSVALSVTGLPSGASGSFSPISGSGSSTLTVRVTLRQRGNYALIISGTDSSNSLTHSTTVSFQER
jgi:hypothetical protein